MSQITGLVFEQPYSDDSGVQYAIRIDRGGASKVTFEADGSVVSFPTEQFRWLLDCLNEASDVLSNG